MANPFDQFDAPPTAGGNPFDQFDQPQPPLTPLTAVRGAVDIAGTGLMNIPSDVLNLPGDIASRLVRGKGYQTFPKFQEQGPGQQLRRAVGEAVQRSNVATRGLLSPEAQRIVAANQPMQPSENRLGIFSDIMQLGGVAGIAGPAARMTIRGGRAVGEMLPGPVERPPRFVTAEDTRAHAMGLRVLGDRPIVESLAGPSRRETIVNTNNWTGVQVGKRLAGVPDEAPLSVSPENNTLRAARDAPLSVYGRVIHGMPTAPIEGAELQSIRGAVTASSDVEARARLQPLADMLTAGPITPQDLTVRLSELRRDGFAGLSSDSAVERNVARGQLMMADALEAHMERHITPAMGTSIEQFRDARQALALNLTVQDVLQGGQLDLPRLGRMYQNAPDRFQDPDLRALADFANKHRASVGREIEGADTAMRTMMEGRISLTQPGTWPRVAHVMDVIPGVRRFGPQAALTRGGGPAAARRTVHRDAGRFAAPPWYQQYEARLEAERRARQVTVPQGARQPERLQLQPPPGRVVEPFQRDVTLPPGLPPRPTLELAPPPGAVVEAMQRLLDVPPGRGRAEVLRQSELFRDLPREADPNAPGGVAPREMPVPFSGPQPPEGVLRPELREFMRGRFSDME